MPPSPGPSRRSTGIIIALAIVVAATILAAVLIMTRSDDEQATTTEPTVTAATTPRSTTRPAPSTTAAPATVTTLPSSTLPGGIALRPSCSSPDYGFSLKYPDGWTAETTFAGWQCALFDPQPFTVTPDTEVPPVAVVVSVPEFAFDDSVAQYTDPSYSQILSTNDLTVDGHRAVAVELTVTQETMLPAGTMRYAVLVEWGARTFVIETDSTSSPSYAINKQVVRGMADTVQLPG
jgi:hypothetical protein